MLNTGPSKRNPGLVLFPFFGYRDPYGGCFKKTGGAARIVHRRSFPQEAVDCPYLGWICTDGMMVCRGKIRESPKNRPDFRWVGRKEGRFCGLVSGELSYILLYYHNSSISMWVYSTNPRTSRWVAVPFVAVVSCTAPVRVGSYGVLQFDVVSRYKYS